MNTRATWNSFLASESKSMQAFYKEMMEMAPMAEPISAIFPALLREFWPAFQRYQDSSTQMQEALDSRLPSESSGDKNALLSKRHQVCTACFVTERRRFEQLREALQSEYDWVRLQLCGDYEKIQL